MENIKIEAFNVIGIAVRTTNENGQAGKDIPTLWEKFMSEGILDKIPNKIDTSVYSLYTDYDSDYTKPYTVVLGCKVNSIETIPEGMVTKSISLGNYTKFITKGDLMKNVVYEKWTEIWNTKLNRKYTTDFEIYGPKSADPSNAEVDIFIATK